MEVLLYDKFIANTKTLKNKILLETFYNNRNDSYAKEKIKLFRKNITQYWCSMSKDNKEKLLNLMNIDENEITNIDNFVKYGWNTPTEEFVEKFYDNKFDYNDEENEQILKSLRENLSNFWKDLNENEKEKYIKLVCERYN
jgi:hypothetical protein